MPGFNDEGIRWFHEWTVKYPKALTIWIGPFRPMLITYHPDTCKQVLRSTEPKQVSGLGGYNLLRPWLGTQILKLIILYSCFLKIPSALQTPCAQN